MPYRKASLEIDGYYHIYSRGVDGRPIFIDQKDYQRFIDLLFHYRFADVPEKFSQVEKSMSPPASSVRRPELVGIVAYCLMPNHFHLILHQREENGISAFIHRVLCSHTCYFNRRHERVGTLFQTRFGAVHVISDNQLLHLSRYIHLNPHTAGLVQHVGDYTFSSYPRYLNGETDGLAARVVLGQFSSPAEYDQFVQDQKDYQRELKRIADVVFEENF